LFRAPSWNVISVQPEVPCLVTDDALRIDRADEYLAGGALTLVGGRPLDAHVNETSKRRPAVGGSESRAAES